MVSWASFLGTLGGRDPQIFGKGWWVVEDGSHSTEGNRIICPEVGVNEQFLPGKSKFVLNCLTEIEIFRNVPWKIEIFQKIFLEKSNFFAKLPEKVEISRKFAWKIEILLTRIHGPT